MTFADYKTKHSISSRATKIIIEETRDIYNEWALTQALDYELEVSEATISADYDHTDPKADEPLMVILSFMSGKTWWYIDVASLSADKAIYLDSKREEKEWLDKRYVSKVWKALDNAEDMTPHLPTLRPH